MIFMVYAVLKHLLGGLHLKENNNSSVNLVRKNKGKSILLTKLKKQI